MGFMKCRWCVFWDYHQDLEGKGWGECRLHAPPGVRNGRSERPHMRCDEGCGEGQLDIGRVEEIESERDRFRLMAEDDRASREGWVRGVPSRITRMYLKALRRAGTLPDTTAELLEELADDQGEEE